jgi:hypothetical protein
MVLPRSAAMAPLSAPPLVACSGGPKVVMRSTMPRAINQLARQALWVLFKHGPIE